MPWTDTKVTNVNNHYIPSGGTTKSASGGTTTNATGSANAQQVITGVTVDAAGHVTGVTSKGIYSTDTNTTYSAASSTTAGLMSANDKKKLDGIADNANNYTYTLPAATSSTLGGVKVGSNISVASGVISMTSSNVTSALGYTPQDAAEVVRITEEEIDAIFNAVFAAAASA